MKDVFKPDLTKNLHPVWHQWARLKQDFMLLFPKLTKQKSTSTIDEATLDKMSSEARERYLRSLEIK